MRLTIAGFALALALTGCGGDDSSGAGRDDPGQEATPSETSTAATFKPSPGASVADLRTTCPEVEAALPQYDDGMAAAVPKVESLSAAGDTETQNALAPVIEAMRELAGAEEVNDLLDARAAYRNSLDGLAGRCAAVGSSALQ